MPATKYLAPLEEGIELPVSFKGEELSFPGRLLNYEYSSKIQLDILGTKLLRKPNK